jgi:hypothetical protein
VFPWSKSVEECLPPHIIQGGPQVIRTEDLLPSPPSEAVVSLVRVGIPLGIMNMCLNHITQAQQVSGIQTLGLPIGVQCTLVKHLSKDLCLGQVGHQHHLQDGVITLAHMMILGVTIFTPQEIQADSKHQSHLGETNPDQAVITGKLNQSRGPGGPHQCQGTLQTMDITHLLKGLEGETQHNPGAAQQVAWTMLV